MSRPREEDAYTVREERSFRPQDKTCLLNFLEEYYFTREPLLNAYLRQHEALVTPTVRDAILRDLRRRYDPIVTDRCMHMVGLDCRTKRRVGVALAVLERRQHRGEPAPWDRVPVDDELLKSWYRDVQRVAERRVDFFAIYPEVNTIMRIAVVCVHEEYAGKRIGTNMVRDMVEKARRRCVDLVYGVVTSQRLRRILERLGFTSHAEMDMREFREADGGAPVYGEACEQMVTVSVMGLKLRVNEE